MRFVNLLKHKITLLQPGTDVILAEIFPTGAVARLVPVRKRNRSVNGITLTVMENKVVDLPAPEKDVMFIVSNVVAQHVRRPDVIAPATGPKDSLRNEAKELIGVYRLQTWENA